MDVQVNYWAVFLAAVSSMIVGMLWYMPSLFGKPWMKLTGVKLNRKLSNNQMARMYVSTFVASLLTAYILAHVTFLSNRFFHHEFLQDALATGFWLWLGFTAARLLVHDIFESRPVALTLLNAGHELATVIVMAMIVGVMGV